MTVAAGVGETFARTVTDGPLLVAAAVAALVGLVSFLSPCVLPLVPGYLSYVTGLSGTETGRPADGGGDRRCGPRRRRGAGWWPAPCCSCSASPRSSSRTGCSSAGSAGCWSEHQRAAASGCSAWW